MKVLVVGAGNSGAEIAMDCARHGHETWLSGRHPGQIPERARGRHYWWLMHERLTAETKPGRKPRAKAYSEGAPLLRLTSGRLKKAGIGLPALLRLDGRGDRRARSAAAQRGVVRGEPGMYVLGLPFIHTLTSAFTGGVGRDAEYVARQIEARSAIERARRHSVEYAGRAA